MGALLYLEDSYLKECDAAVVSAAGKELVLERNLFYPKGGGQPSDSGSISTISGSQFRVLNVLKKDGRIVHELDRESGLKPGDKVHCRLDWERRYKLMRMHTAAHVLAATMHMELGALITGNQIEEDKTRFDFSMPGFDRARFDEIVVKANEALSSDTAIKVYSLPRDEAMRIPGVVKLAAALPPSITELRIVEIPGI
ncbi:MAG: alanine--tRNA ligase-related protein, partial [Candidatus Micrarchaeota archaeon]